MHQVEMISLDFLVPEAHAYRRVTSIWSFSGAEKRLKKFEKDNSHKGFGLLRFFKCLLLELIESTLTQVNFSNFF